jgi:hypothetical protein
MEMSRLLRHLHTNLEVGGGRRGCRSCERRRTLRLAWRDRIVRPSAPASKAGRPARVSRVRIPLPPPHMRRSEAVSSGKPPLAVGRAVVQWSRNGHKMRGCDATRTMCGLDAGACELSGRAASVGVDRRSGSGGLDLDPVDAAGRGGMLLEHPAEGEPGVLVEPVLVTQGAHLCGHTANHEQPGLGALVMVDVLVVDRRVSSPSSWVWRVTALPPCGRLEGWRGSPLAVHP